MSGDSDNGWGCQQRGQEGISIIEGSKLVTMDEAVGKGDGVGKSVQLGDGVCMGDQRSTCSGREWVVHPGVMTLDRRVVGDEVWEDRIVVEVNDGELMTFNGWFCKWE